MQLQHWSHLTRAGFNLRGLHTPPSGRPVIHFLHGNGFCGLSYRPLLERLAEHFDLFLSDAQGHGDSDHGGRFVGWNHSADYALDAWHAHQARFGTVPVFAVGHSFGSVLTSLMLARAPTSFQGAVLLDPVLFPPAMVGLMALSDVIGLYSRNQPANRARKRQHHWSSRSEAADKLRNRGMFRGWQEDALQAYVTNALRDHPGGGVELKCSPAREAEIFGSYPRRLWSSLARITTPTRVLRGAGSYPFAARAIERWVRRNPAVSCQVLPGGHCFMQEVPAASATAMIDYLSTIPDAPDPA